MFTSCPAIFDEFAQFDTPTRADVAACQFLSGHAAAFNALGEFNFLCGGKQRDTADFLKIQPDGIVRINIGEIVIQ